MVDMGLLMDRMMSSGNHFYFLFFLPFARKNFAAVDRLLKSKVQGLNASAMLPSTVRFAHQMRRAILITFVAAKPMLPTRLP
jgi:hypothetical protein